MVDLNGAEYIRVETEQMDLEDPKSTQSGSCCTNKTLGIVVLGLASLVAIAGAGSALYFTGVIGSKAMTTPPMVVIDCPLGYAFNQTLRDCVNKYDNEDDGFADMVHSDRIWTSNLILYTYASGKEFSFNAAEKKEIRKNMDKIIMNLAPACLEFIEIGKPEIGQKFMDLQKMGKACRAHVGRKDEGKTEIQLGAECFEHEGTILHELMHIIGVYHEMNRPDRDLFLDVYQEKIKKEHQSEFARKNTTKYDLSNITPYDVYSIMNYHEFQACNQGELCMQVKDIFKQKFKTLDGYPLQHPITKMSATDIVDISRKYTCDIQPDTQREYVKYALNITEVLLQIIDQECSTSDDIVCQTLKFEAQTYLTDIETTWSDDYGKQMREQYCNMYEKEPVFQVSKSIKNLQDWFEKKEKK